MSGNTRLEGLLATFKLESPEETLRADGDDQLIYVFDLRGEQLLQSVEVEAVLGNDYRVDWSGIFVREGQRKTIELDSRYQSMFYQTAARAEGRADDLSNLRRVRFSVGGNTGIFTFSADLHLRLRWLEVTGEYARSAVYARYPAEFDDRAQPRQGSRFTSRGYSPFAGLINDTVVWRLVQDNDDGDRWPDLLGGNVLGSPLNETGTDFDGVFPGQDADLDGVIDTDQNVNGTPDYEEAFLRYNVEPNEYVYGLDRNNNDEPDHREDDWDADYAYDPGQRGHHLFAQVDLSGNWSVAAGRYAAKSLDGGGHSRSLYGLLNYLERRRGRLRLRLNWQQGGQLDNGLFQRERRLDLWTLVSRVEYSWT